MKVKTSIHMPADASVGLRAQRAPCGTESGEAIWVTFTFGDVNITVFIETGEDMTDFLKTLQSDIAIELEHA